MRSVRRRPRGFAVWEGEARTGFFFHMEGRERGDREFPFCEVEEKIARTVGRQPKFVAPKIVHTLFFLVVGDSAGACERTYYV